MIIIYKFLMYGEEQTDWLCLVAVQPEGFGPRLLVSEDMVTVGAEVVAECWSDRWVLLYIVFVPLTVPVKEDYNLVVYHCDVKINK